MEVEEFDALCEELARKHAQIKQLEDEIKPLKAKVTEVLQARYDPTNKTYKIAGASFTLSRDLYPGMPSELDKKKELFEAVRKRSKKWYQHNLKFDSRSFKSWCDEEREASLQTGSEFELDHMLDFTERFSLRINSSKLGAKK